MSDALAMRLVQRIGNFDGVLQNLLQRQRTFCESLRKRLAFEMLHHQVVGPILVAHVIERADVRMIQAGDDAGLALEPLARLRARSKMCGKHLDGNDAIESRVSSLIHLAHAAFAELRDDLVVAEPSPVHGWAFLTELNNGDAAGSVPLCAVC